MANSKARLLVALCLVLMLFISTQSAEGKALPGDLQSSSSIRKDASSVVSSNNFANQGGLKVKRSLEAPSTFNEERESRRWRDRLRQGFRVVQSFLGGLFGRK